jgi:alpha-glucosidase/alpha-D-xyloside xylohydrolase
MGDPGPVELEHYRSPAGLPDRKEFNNADVEPVCRKYLDLRYRLLPYLYSAVREAHDTGLPMMRALWLHYPGDLQAEERGDEYLWGRDILVAPVVEKGATSRRLYLPHGLWYDFWTEAKAEGGREITRPVDLATIPIYLRAGAIIPLGPVKQYTAEKTVEPLTVKIYPGANGRFVMYEDDGTTFDYEKGRFTRVRFEWNEHNRNLRVLLEPGSTLLPPSPRRIDLQMISGGPSRSVVFDGKPLDVAF